MGDSEKRVLQEHALEEEHIPVPAGHAPRLEATYAFEGLCVYERDNPAGHVIAENPVEVRE
jgi:hypothetical protein